MNVSVLSAFGVGVAEEVVDAVRGVGEPVGPVLPVGPVGPVIPVVPVGPVTPVAPVRMAFVPAVP
jgi:hypothetical protein